MALDHPPIALSSPERTLLRSLWECDASVPLVDTTIGALLARRAEQQPDSLALIGTRHDGTTVRWSYQQLYQEARRVAAGLLRVAEPGDHVGLWAPNVAEWPLIEYGVALAGMVIVALNPTMRADELDYALRISRTSVLIHADVSRDYDLASVVRHVSCDLPDLRRTISLSEVDALLGEPSGSPDAARVEAPAMIQFTSGTTGRPKGVLLGHRSLVNNARLAMITAGVSAGAVTVAPLPMFHTGGCGTSTLGPAWLGGTQVLIEKFDPVAVLKIMAAEQATLLLSVPTVLSALLEVARKASEPTHQLDTVIVGASTVPPSMIEAVEATFGASVHNFYGQTEFSPAISLTRRSDTREDILSSVGRPLPHTDVAIVRPESGEIAPIGVSGEIRVRGCSQMIEYYRDAEGTATAVDAEGWLHTGDLGRMNDRGTITLTGRLKDLIIRGGENIAPAEIEIILAGHPDVLHVAVIGLPDDHWGETIAAAVVPRKSVDTGLAENLSDFCQARLAKHKVPAQWFLVDELPTTASGKVQKFALRRLLLDTEPAP